MEALRVPFNTVTQHFRPLNWFTDQKPFLKPGEQPRKFLEANMIKVIIEKFREHYHQKSLISQSLGHNGYVDYDGQWEIVTDSNMMIEEGPLGCMKDRSSSKRGKMKKHSWSALALAMYAMETGL